jgi:hypothetical protein
VPHSTFARGSTYGPSALWDHRFEQNHPTDKGVSAIADARLDGQVQVARFMD